MIGRYRFQNWLTHTLTPDEPAPRGQRKKPPVATTSTGGLEHKDRFAAMRRTVEAVRTEGK